MELVLILSISLAEMFRIHLFQVVEIVRAFWIYTFMQDKELPALFGNQGVAAVRAAQLYGGEAVFLLRKLCVADFTGELSFCPVVLIEVRLWCFAAGTGTVFRDVAFRTAPDGTDLFPVAFFKVRDQLFVRPVLAEISNERKFINLVFLVFGGMGIIKRPLFERDISADKI